MESKEFSRGAKMTDAEKIKKLEEKVKEKNKLITKLKRQLKKKEEEETTPSYDFREVTYFESSR